VGRVREQWANVTTTVADAARVLDGPLRLMLDRAWVGGRAPRFEQDLAGRRQALQRAWQHLLETLAANDAAEQRAAGQRLTVGVGSHQAVAPLQVPPPLRVPSITTSVTTTATSCYPSGAFTGVDLDGFDALAAKLTAGGPALLAAIETLPADALAGIGLGTASTAADMATIQDIAAWSRTQGRDITARLDLIHRADTAKVTGLTAPHGLSGPLIPATMAGTVLFAPSPPDTTRTALHALANGDATALPGLLRTQRAGYDPFLAAQITLAWKTLTPDQQKTLISKDPASLGTLDGIPATTRDQANRTVLKTEVVRLRGELARNQHLRTRLIHLGGPTVAVDQEISRVTGILKGLDAISNRIQKNRGVPVLLLGLDTAHHGQAIVAFGDPDTATDTITYVPGLTTKLSGAHGDMQRARDTYQQAIQSAAKLAPGHTVASVYWLGYNPPQLDTTALVPGRTVAGTGPAQEGAPWLASYTSGLRATHHPDVASHVTVLGHSYGSLTTGTAARLAPGSFADDIIVVGSPGVGADHATDLGLPGSHVFAGAAANDPVTTLPSRNVLPLAAANPFIGVPAALGEAVANHYGADGGAFGTNPARPSFGATPFAVAPNHLATAHSSYWDTDTSHDGSDESLSNISYIAIGKADLITPAR
jgi:hypothetical protein